VRECQLNTGRIFCRKLNALFRKCVLRSTSQRRVMKPVFSILIILLSFNPLSASEISVVSLLGNSDVKRDAIIIEGEIANQDYKRFLSALNTTYMRNPAGPSRVYLYTLGGDAIEAMKIGRLIRKLRLSTGAPSITSTGDISCCDFKAWRLPISKSNCNCASAGFLIWIAGIERTGNVLGIHRTFIDHGLLRTMSEKAALKYTNQVYDQTGRYLTEMGAGSNLIELRGPLKIGCKNVCTSIQGRNIA